MCFPVGSMATHWKASYGYSKILIFFDVNHFLAKNHTNAPITEAQVASLDLNEGTMAEFRVA